MGHKCLRNGLRSQALEPTEYPVTLYLKCATHTLFKRRQSEYQGIKLLPAAFAGYRTVFRMLCAYQPARSPCPISVFDLCATLQRILLSSLLQTRKMRCRISSLDSKENASSLQCVFCFIPHLQLLRDSFHFGMVSCCYGLNMAPTEHCKLNSQCNSVGKKCILVTRSWGLCPYRWSDAAA